MFERDDDSPPHRAVYVLPEMTFLAAEQWKYSCAVTLTWKSLSLKSLASKKRAVISLSCLTSTARLVANLFSTNS